MTTRQRFGRALIAEGIRIDSMGLAIDPGAIYDCREDGRITRCGIDIVKKRKAKK